LCSYKSIVSAIKKPHTDNFIGTQRKGQEQNDDLKLSYKKQESDVLNGSTGHSKENGDEASEKLECPIIKYEKMKDLEPETGEQEDTRVNEETNGIKNELKENEKAEIKEETNVKGEIEKGHDEPDIPTLKSNIKSDTRKYAEITSPIRVSANNEALSENKTEFFHKLKETAKNPITDSNSGKSASYCFKIINGLNILFSAAL
jgi:hypothetical protein